MSRIRCPVKCPIRCPKCNSVNCTGRVFTYAKKSTRYSYFCSNCLTEFTKDSEIIYPLYF